MSDLGVSPEPGSVRFERILPGPIERVWAYLTESEKRRQWLAAGPMELRPGGRVSLTFRHSELAVEKAPPPAKHAKNEGASFDGTVTRCEPPRLLSMSWGDDGSEVTFELEPRGSDVRLVLTHRRLPDAAQMADVSGGWHVHLRVLSDVLNGRPPQPFWPVLAKVEAQYEKLFLNR